MGYNRTLGHFTNSQELATVWASGQNYIVNQLVLDNNKLYRCITAHTSGATFAGDSANWVGLNPGATVAISEGGTGQTTAVAAFDALAPTTTAGDLIVYNGTDNVRLPVGTDGQMIVADASQTNKLKWATVPQGSKNYITYSNFENNATTGWSLFNTTLDANKIPNGAISPGPSVTNPLSALSINSISPLAGSYSLSVTSAGSINAAQGFITDVLTIDREDQAKVLTFSFYYEALTTNMNFSGTSSNTWAIYIHDGTNWIQPAGVYGMTQSSGAGLVTGTFQTNATGTSYRVAVLCINSVSGTISMRFDDFKLGPQTAPIGAAMTDFQDRGAMTIGGATSAPTKGTVVTDKVFVRREGDSARIRYYYRQSAASANGGVGTYLFSLPSGLSFDSTKINITGNLDNMIGTFGGRWGGGIDQYSGYACATSATQFIIYLQYQRESGVAQGGGLLGSSVGSLAAAGDMIYVIDILAPISGWSSQVQFSSDTDTRVVAFSAYDGGSVSVTNTTAILPMGNTEVDTHSVRSGNTYVVPVSGFYRLAAKSTSRFSVGNVTFNHALLFYKNGVVQNNGDYGNADGANSAGVEFFFLSINSIVRLNAGDVIDFRYFTNYTGTATTYLKYCSIERLSGPSVVASSETVAMTASASTTSIANASPTPVVFTNVQYDSHKAYNSTTGVYLIPVSGKFTISGYLYWNNAATGASFRALIYKNSTKMIDGSWGVRVGTEVASISTITINCVAGDTIQICGFHADGAARALSGGNSEQVFCITRVGN